MCNPCAINIAAICWTGFDSYSVARLVDDRPNSIYLWPPDGDGLHFCVESKILRPRLEVGILRVGPATRSEAMNSGLESVRLPKSFLGSTSSYVVQTSDAGVVFDSGVYFLSQSGGEMLITAANYPHALSFFFQERTKDYEPEYPIPYWRFIELKK